MFADWLMLGLAFGTLLVPLVWMSRPLQLVNPFAQCGPKLTYRPALTEVTL